MEDHKYVVNTAVIVYNSKQELLVIRRGDKEQHGAGIHAYPGGRIDFEEEFMDVLESNARKELKEETGVNVSSLSYLNSHMFRKNNGNYVILICFLGKYESGELTPEANGDTSEVFWIAKDEIDGLNTIPVVKKLYNLAYTTITNHEG